MVIERAAGLIRTTGSGRVSEELTRRGVPP
jgi:hypothetical protein